MIFSLTVAFATAHCQLAKNQHRQKIPTLAAETQNSHGQNTPCCSDSDLKIMKLNNTTGVYSGGHYKQSRKAHLEKP